MTGIDPNVLLAIAKVETDWGRARQGQPDALEPADIRAGIDATALQPDAATIALLGLPDGRRIGVWVNLHAIGPAQEHAIGNAIDLYGVAAAEGFQVSGQPVAGSMVVYGLADVRPAVGGVAGSGGGGVHCVPSAHRSAPGCTPRSAGPRRQVTSSEGDDDQGDYEAARVRCQVARAKRTPQIRKDMSHT
jgi:hypothetical protein